MTNNDNNNLLIRLGIIDEKGEPNVACLLRIIMIMFLIAFTLPQE